MKEISAPRKLIPALAWYTPFEPFALAFIRFGLGAILAAHGVNRLFYHGPHADLGPLLGRAPAVVGAYELVGGVLLALGFLTRPVALLFAAEWFIIALRVPLKPGTPWLLLGATPHFPAYITALCVIFMFRGGGYYSLDRMVGKEI